MSVGKSYRTPAKHALMCSIAGKEIGVSGNHAGIDRLLWLDLTAGDGIVEDELDWTRNCSPGIAANHARNSMKPILVMLHEIAPATFDELEKSLRRHLPALGYCYANGAWWCNNAQIRLVPGSGSEVDVSSVTHRTAVLATNDPNAITDWAMRPTFAAEVRSRTRWYRSVSTMGCNPAGLKRLEPTIRHRWFDLVGQQQENLPRHHDLFLAAIEKDDAQWAYLIDEAATWRIVSQKIAETAFGRNGMSIESAWSRQDAEHFGTMLDRLFLTKAERAA